MMAQNLGLWVPFTIALNGPKLTTVIFFNLALKGPEYLDRTCAGRLGPHQASMPPPSNAESLEQPSRQISPRPHRLRLTLLVRY